MPDLIEQLRRYAGSVEDGIRPVEIASVAQRRSARSGLVAAIAVAGVLLVAGAVATFASNDSDSSVTLTSEPSTTGTSEPTVGDSELFRARTIAEGRAGRERHTLSLRPGGPNGFCVALSVSDNVISDSCGLSRDPADSDLVAEPTATEESAYLWGRTGAHTVRIEIEIDNGSRIIEFTEADLASDPTGRYFVAALATGTEIETVRALGADGAVLDTVVINSIPCPCG